MRSKKILRQIKKSFLTENIEAEFQTLFEQLKAGEMPTDLPSWRTRLEGLSQFLDFIDNTYAQHDTAMELANRSLEVSTKELYEANEKSRFALSAMNSMVNSLDEGFLVINHSGICDKLVSQSAIHLLGRNPQGEPLSKILNVPKEDEESFSDWFSMILSEVIPFEDLVDLAPKSLLPNTTQRNLEIKFKPIRDEETQKIKELVLILIDVTEKAEVERRLTEQKLLTDMVLQYLNNKSNFKRILYITKETIDSMKSWIFNPADWGEQLSSLARELHSLKGGLNTLSIYSLGYKVHQIEDEISAFTKKNSYLPDIENLIHLLAQDFQDTLDEFFKKYRPILILDSKDSTLTKEIPVDNIYRFSTELLRAGLTDLLQRYVDEVIAVPLSSMFAAIEAGVYSLSLNYGYPVEFIIHDPQKIKVVPEFYIRLFDNLVHIFNNMIDHGMETEKERQILGKSPMAHIDVHLTLTPNAQYPSNQTLQLILTDDGKGIDPSLIKEKLTSRGLNVNTESDQQIINHIFDEGFSSREVANLTAGRGVGLFAVKKAVEEINGDISVTSTVGQGTSFKIRVPYVKEIDSSTITQVSENLKSGDKNTLLKTVS